MSDRTNNAKYSTAVGRYWVVIETGSNQRYIFGTNKRRANVGASELVRRVGTDWVSEAVRAEGFKGDVTSVIEASGKAILLVADQVDGRRVVSAVTHRALLEAPGLGVCGAVDDSQIQAGSCMREALRQSCHCASCRLDAVHRALSQARANLGAPDLRWPTNPFSEPCTYTGLPAVTVGAEAKNNDPQARSAQFQAVFDHQAGRPAAQGLKHMKEMVGDTHVPAILTFADPVQDPVRNSGWIAVVHADGNGIGNLFLNLSRKILSDRLVETMRDFSMALDEVTRAAVKAAVDKTASAHPDSEGKTPSGWILPIIVGGDDVTVIIDGRLALDFTEAFLAEFASRAAASETIDEVNRAVNPRPEEPAGTPALPSPQITASAGIAFIKPHHPFSDGYTLAEELCKSAKDLTKHSGGASALDFHVLFDSVGRDLEVLRDRQQIVPDENGQLLRLWAGPVLADTAIDTAIAEQAAPGVPTLTELRDCMAKISRSPGERPGAITSTSAHAMRAALTRGGTAIKHAREQAVLRAPNPGAAGKALDAFLAVPTRYEVEGTAEMSYWLDALALNEVAAGTVASRETTESGEA